MHWFAEKNGFDRSLCFSNFNHRPLVWHFTSMASTKTNGQLYKNELFDCYIMTILVTSLLAKSNKPSMELKRYQTQALEIFKTLNALNQPTCRNFFMYVLHPQGNQIYSNCKNKY